MHPGCRRGRDFDQGGRVREPDNERLLHARIATDVFVYHLSFWHCLFGKYVLLDNRKKARKNKIGEGRERRFLIEKDRERGQRT